MDKRGSYVPCQCYNKCNSYYTYCNIGKDVKFQTCPSSGLSFGKNKTCVNLRNLPIQLERLLRLPLNNSNCGSLKKS